MARGGSGADGVSFSRWGVDDSAVYTFKNTEGRYECCGCPLAQTSVDFADAHGLLTHLRAHQQAGQHVPDYVIARLEADAERP